MTPKVDPPAEATEQGSTEPARAPARAVLYLRVSTKEQAEMGGEAEGYSIPAQRDACARKAAALGAEVVGEYVDRGESAKTAHRPELQRMLQAVATEPVDFLIVHKVDRLARNRADDVQINLALQAAGVTLVSCTESIDETPSGMLLHGIMSSIAEFYSRNLANEVIKGSVQKAKSGGTVGKAPTGYLNVRRYENGVESRTVEIDPQRGPLMSWAFDEYASGQWTIRSLLDELTRRGLDSAPSPRMPSKPLSVSNFHRLLRHPYYKGIVRYRGVEYEGKHQPLTSEATWNRVQEVLDAQRLAGERTVEHPHYLKGTVYCGICGHRLVVSKNRGRRGTLYEYFVCIGRGQKRTTCTQRAVAIDVVEALVEDLYQSVQPTPELLNRLQAVLLQDLRTQDERAEKQRRANDRKLRALQNERTKLLEGYYAGAIPMDLMKAEQQRIAKATAALESMSRSFAESWSAIEANLHAAVELAGNWHRAYVGATDRERRLLNQAIFEKVFITHEGEVTHRFQEPFNMLLSEPMVALATDLPEASVSALATDELAKRRTEREQAMTDGRADGTPLDQDNQRTPVATMWAVGGSNVDYLVGAEGLEPPTSAL